MLIFSDFFKRTANVIRHTKNKKIIAYEPPYTYTRDHIPEP